MSSLPRLLIIYAIAIPMAAVLGFLIADPSMMTVVVIGLVIFLLLLPLIINHHHTLLIVFWNSVFLIFFLPSAPPFWLGLAALSFGISWLNNIMGQKNFLRVPELNKPLLFIAAVTVVTMICRGGTGLGALGSSIGGGKGYIYVIMAILGYFALTAEAVPLKRSKKLVGWHLLMGTTPALGNLIYLLGPAFYLLYLLVPAGLAYSQAAADIGATNIDRISGMAPACVAVICLLLARYGLRGVFDWRRPWLTLFFVGSLAGVSFGGYRSELAVVGLLFFWQLWFERLHRTVFLPIFAGLAIALLAGAILYSDRLPQSVQRTISFLPVHVDPSVRADAEYSTQWRWEMWRVIAPDIPRYFLIGKGFVIDQMDLYLASEAQPYGLTDPFEVSRVAGDYHNGMLSVIIPLGFAGFAGFVWLVVAGIKVLYRNYRYGNPELRSINTFFLSYFMTQMIVYFVIFGAFHNQLYIFTGILGLSVSLNGGVAKKPVRAPAPLAAAVPQLVAQPV